MTSSREYPSRPLVGIGIIVLQPDAVLLIKRGRPPALGQWSLPGGAQRVGETIEQTARRELMEETGLQVGDLTFIAHVDSIHHDRDGKVQFHYTILDFGALWQHGEPRPGGDVTDARFVAFDDLTELHLWHEVTRVIGLARQRLLPGHNLKPA